MFWENFVKYCNSVGKSPTSVALDIGLSDAAPTGWKKGAKPRDSVLQRMSAYFGCSIEDLTGEIKKAPTDEISERKKITDEAHHIGELFDLADDADKVLTHNVLDKYDVVGQITVISTKKNPGGFLELDVYDEPAAAGLGNYLSAPESRREQFPSFMVPKGASCGIRISGDSMEPVIGDGSTVFVKHTMTVESGKVGIFVLNGSSYCKQLIVDKAKQEVRLHSLNPRYDDIVVTPADDLRTIGQVL